MVFAMTPISAEPAERAFNDPTLGQQYKSLRMDRAQNRLQDPAEGFSHPFRQPAFAVRRVCPYHFQTSKAATQALDHPTSAVIVLDSGRMYHHRQDQAEGIHGDVPFASHDF